MSCVLRSRPTRIRSYHYRIPLSTFDLPPFGCCEAVAPPNDGIRLHAAAPGLGERRATEADNQEIRQLGTLTPTLQVLVKALNQFSWPSPTQRCNKTPNRRPSEPKAVRPESSGCQSQLARNRPYRIWCLSGQPP